MTTLRMDRDRAWKGWLLAGIVAAHMWVGWSLAQFRPVGIRTATHSRAEPSSTEVLLELTFQPPTAKARKANAARASSPRRPGSRPRSGTVASGGAAVADHQADIGAGAPEPLNLAAPVDATPVFSQPDLFQRRTALEYHGTRYDKAWISEGNLTEVVTRKSKIAGVLLQAMGALRKPCTEEQRSRYERGCVTDQYRHPGPGE